MQDIIDEALQRLYWACRERTGFPGLIPDESSGRVSTDAILRGLGLSPPQVDNPQPGGSRSDSMLDTRTHRLLPRSYHPPDIRPPPQVLSQNLATPSTMTPLSPTGDDRHTFGEAVPRRHNTSTMEVDEEDDGISDGLSDGMPDGLPDGLGQEFQDGMDTSIDPKMLQAGHLGSIGGSTYSNMGGLPFGSGLPLGSHGRQMPPHSANQFGIPSLDQQRLESVTQSLGTVELPDGLLPWPGNMASIYRQGEAEDAVHGFDNSADDGER
ncbi:hypothetical protein, variant 3 [Phialophora macrospora]|nr:hypothetical protein, variant 3 [Phialophora macrospora]